MDEYQRQVGGPSISPQGREMQQEPSIAQLLSNLLGDAQTLVRKEFTLARVEIANEIDRARQGAIALGIGAGITAAGLLFLLFTLVYLISDLADLSLWVSYLIVGAPLTIIGVFALVVGMRRVQQVDPVPHETIDSVRKDVEWLKEPNRSDKI